MLTRDSFCRMLEMNEEITKLPFLVKFVSRTQIKPMIHNWGNISGNFLDKKLLFLRTMGVCLVHSQQKQFSCWDNSCKSLWRRKIENFFHWTSRRPTSTCSGCQYSRWKGKKKNTTLMAILR